MTIFPYLPENESKTEEAKTCGDGGNAPIGVGEGHRQVKTVVQHGAAPLKPPAAIGEDADIANVIFRKTCIGQPQATG